MFENHSFLKCLGFYKLLDFLEVEKLFKLAENIFHSSLIQILRLLTKGVIKILTGYEGGFRGWTQSYTSKVFPMWGVSKNIITEPLLSSIAEIWILPNLTPNFSSFFKWLLLSCLLRYMTQLYIKLILSSYTTFHHIKRFLRNYLFKNRDFCLHFQTNACLPPSNRSDFHPKYLKRTVWSYANFWCL